MTSKEMEARSGVARANIRYYEAEGLLTPARMKNGYRDYSEEDLALLEKIKLLRRLGVSVQELKELRAGQAELSAVLDRRLAELQGERLSQQRVETVCGALRLVKEVTPPEISARPNQAVILVCHRPPDGIRADVQPDIIFFLHVPLDNSFFLLYNECT